jgi:agmatine deiminase
MTQIVYISAHLPEAKEKQKYYGKSVYNDLRQILGDRLVEINHNSNNVWCRDYMPVKSATGSYVHFKYKPSYMVGIEKYADKFPDREELQNEFQLPYYTTSEIILDGGAIEIFGKKGIVSDRVFRDNKNKGESEIYDELKKLLDLEQLIVIPQYPYDFTGHVDGLVRFIDENRVVVNDLKKEFEEAQNDKNSYRKQLIENWIYTYKSALINAGLQMVELPTSIPEGGSPNSGEGIYSNFLLLEDLIIMPGYDKPEDKMAADRLTDLYGKKVTTVYAAELAKQGGMINCVTWTK